MLTVKGVTKDIGRDKVRFGEIRDLYATAFPRREQVPLPYLISKTNKDCIKFNAYYDGDVFVGLTYTITYRDMTYLWYFATRAEMRSKGYGSQILAHLRTEHPGRIILNLDVQDEAAADSDIRKRRKEFYLRNGYVCTGYLCMFGGNKLDTMVINGEISFDEFASIFKVFFGPVLYFFSKPKKITNQF